MKANVVQNKKLVLVDTWLKTRLSENTWAFSRPEQEFKIKKNKIKIKQKFCKSDFGATHRLSVHEDADSSCNFAGKQDNQAAEELQDRMKTKHGFWLNK